jgi:hypothetical protein
MAIRITCPGCKTALSLSEEMRGKKVRCKHCEKVIGIPAADAPKHQAETATQTERKVKLKTAPPSEESHDEDEDRPAKKKKKKKKKQGSSTLLIAGGAAVFLLLVCAVAVSAVFWPRDPDAKAKQQAKADEKKDAEKIVVKGGIQFVPPIQEGPPTKKGGAGIVQNVRGAVYRTDRKAELHSLHLSYQQFRLTDKNGTYDDFLVHIKNDGAVAGAVKDGYYQMNMKARLDGDNIIAYERDEDAPGHLCVRANGEMPYVPAAQLKKELGLP